MPLRGKDVRFLSRVLDEMLVTLSCEVDMLNDLNVKPS